MEDQKSITIEQLLEAMAAEAGKRPETMELLAQLNEKAVFEHCRDFACGPLCKGDNGDECFNCRDAHVG